ncbi:MAG: hypothetical protein ACI9XZ_000434 [Alphaproteobacteria bacterium]|jgi:hypothetical protein
MRQVLGFDNAALRIFVRCSKSAADGIEWRSNTLRSLTSFLRLQLSSRFTKYGVFSGRGVIPHRR